MLLESLNSRVNYLTEQNEDLQRTLKIFSRILVESGLATKENIKNAIKKDYEVLKELGAVERDLSDEELDELTNTLYTHTVGSPEEVKALVDEARKRMEEELKKQESKIEIANANTLNLLNNNSPKQSSKLIL